MWPSPVWATDDTRKTTVISAVVSSVHRPLVIRDLGATVVKRPKLQVMINLHPRMNCLARVKEKQIYAANEKTVITLWK
jgi:hypothetical protein